ncbi:YbaK/EbsC family protein [Candidatus Uhrbacteria bacterium]|nr:YbaK/EbsC family protein [Candidatus Uhrbacteria bacterium]
MAVPPRLLRFLDQQHVAYHVVPHRTVYTAFDLATTLHVDVRHVAKALLVRADRQYVLAVVPAHARVDMAKLGKLVHARVVTIAPEAAIRKLRVLPGTMPPFGSFLGVSVVMDRSLTKVRAMIVRAGSSTDSVRISVRDFMRVESPTVGAFVVRGNVPAASRVGSRRVVAKRAKPVAPKRGRTNARQSSRRTPRKTARR